MEAIGLEWQSDRMEKEIKFFVAHEMPLRTAQQKGVQVVRGKPHYFTKPEIKTQERELVEAFSLYAPEHPIEGPVELKLVFCMKHPKGKTQSLSEAIPHTVRPDADNLAKQVVDALTKSGFWKDDAQVYHMDLWKVRYAEPGIAVEVTA